MKFISLGRNLLLLAKIIICTITFVYLPESSDLVKCSVGMCGILELFGVFFALFMIIKRYKGVDGISFGLWIGFLAWEVVNVVILRTLRPIPLYCSLVSSLLLLTTLLVSFIWRKKNKFSSSSSRDTISLYFDRTKSSLSLQIDSEQQLSNEIHQKTPSESGEKTAIVILAFSAKTPEQISVCQFDRVRIIREQKSKTLIESASGQIGYVPSVILKIN